MSRNYAPKSDPSKPPNQGHSLRIGDKELYYETEGSGQPLLLLHGFGGCTRNWQPFRSELSQHYQLILVDLPGHGQSTNPGNSFTHRQAAIDLLHLLDHLKINKVPAMGMSTGAMVLLHMVNMQPERIGAMVLVSATTHFPEQARVIMRRASFNTLPPEVRNMYSACAKRGEPQIRALIQQFNNFADNQNDMNFSADDLSVIRSPTLLVHGDRDHFFPLDIVLSLNRAIAGSELWIVPNGEHVPIYEDVMAFNRRALNFLSQKTTSTG